MNAPVDLILSDACADSHEYDGRFGSEDDFHSYAEWMGLKAERTAWENYLGAPTAESMAEEDRVRLWDVYYGPEEYRRTRSLEVVMEEEGRDLPMWLLDVSHNNADLLSPSLP